MQTLKKLVSFNRDSKGKTHIFQSGSQHAECGRVTVPAEGQASFRSLLHVDSITCFSCQRTILYKDHRGEIIRSAWIKYRNHVDANCTYTNFLAFKSSDKYACSALDPERLKKRFDKKNKKSE